MKLKFDIIFDILFYFYRYCGSFVESMNLVFKKLSQWPSPGAQADEEPKLSICWDFSDGCCLWSKVSDLFDWWQQQWVDYLCQQNWREVIQGVLWISKFFFLKLTIKTWKLLALLNFLFMFVKVFKKFMLLPECVFQF